VPAAAEPPRTVGDPVEEPWWFVESIDIPKLFDDLLSQGSVYIDQTDEALLMQVHTVYASSRRPRAYTC
jgi:hypothetical protein